MPSTAAVTLRRAVLVTSLAVLLGLAGCSGAPGDQTRVANETITMEGGATTDTATAVPAIDSDQAPPGVNESAVDTEALLRAHFDRLQDSSHTITIRTSQRRNTQTITETRVLRVEGSNASVRNAYSSAPVQSTAWTNSSTTARRYTASGAEAETRYTVDARPIQLQQISGQRRFVAFLSATNFTVAENTEQEETTITTLESNGTPDNRSVEALFRTAEVSDYAVRVEATTSGVITQIEVNATVGPSERSFEWSERYTVTEVGSTTVERPAWVGTASQRATRLNATLSANASYLRVQHRGGDPVPANAIVQWTLDPRQRPKNANLGVPLESGDTIYASVTNGSVQFTREPPAPGSTDELTNGLALRFATQNGLPIGTATDAPAQPAENTSAPPSGQ